ncbi:MAG: hypothetical protein KAR57_03700 [Bacteroidales bacterium]|nr:hypothetical protein [Bacteroidales bacterium]
MLKKYLLLIVFLILTSNIYSQIEKEISSFVDSSELVITNGRRLLIQSVKEKDHEKIKQIYEYLLDVSTEKGCYAFSFIEELYINTLISDWDKWINLASNLENENRKYCFQIKYELREALSYEIANNVDVLLYNSNYLANEERQIIDIYLYIIKYGSENEVYNKKIQDYKKEFKNSKFNYFLNNALPRPNLKGATGVSLGANSILLTNNLDESFTSKLAFSMSWDFNISKFYGSIYMVGGEFQLQTSYVTQIDGSSYTFEKGEEFNYLEYGFNGGMYLLRGHRFHVAPYASISGSFLKSNIYEPKEEREDDEFRPIKAFSCGFGLHTEIKLIEFKAKNFYYTGASENSYIGLKLDFGYNYLTTQEDILFKGNVIYFRPALIWAFGDF